MIENIFKDCTSALRYDFHRCMYDFFQQKGYHFYWIKNYDEEYYYLLKKEQLSLISSRIKIISPLDSFELFYEKNLFSMSFPHFVSTYHLRDFSERFNKETSQDFFDFSLYFFQNFINYQIYLPQYCQYFIHIFRQNNSYYLRHIIEQIFDNLEDIQQFLMNDAMNSYKHYLLGEDLVTLLNNKKATQKQIDQFILTYYFSLDFSKEENSYYRLNYQLKNFLLKYFQDRKDILLPYCSLLPPLERYFSQHKISIESDLTIITFMVEINHLINNFMIDFYSWDDYEYALKKIFTFITHHYDCHHTKFEHITEYQDKHYIVMSFICPDKKLTLSYFKELIFDYLEKIYEDPTISCEEHLDNFFSYREYKRLNQELPLSNQELIEKGKI